MMLLMLMLLHCSDVVGLLLVFLLFVMLLVVSVVITILLVFYSLFSEQ